MNAATTDDDLDIGLPEKGRGTGCWGPAALGVLLLIGLGALGIYLYDRHWEGKLEAKVAQLSADGQLITLDEMINRHTYLPDEENSAFDFMDARGQVQETPHGGLASELLDASPPGVLPSVTLQEWIREDLEANAETLRLMHEAARLPRGCYPLVPASDPWSLGIPGVIALRRAGQLCVREGIFHAIEGDSAGAAGSLVTCRRLAAAIGQRPFLIEQLVRMASDGLLVDAVERVVGLCPIDEDELDALIQELEREQAELSLDWLIVAERSSGQYAFGHADDLARGYGEPGSAKPAAYRWVPGWRERDALYFHEVMDQYVELGRLSAADKAIRGEELGETLEEELSASSLAYPLSSTIIPAMGHAFSGEPTTKARLCVAHTALQVEKWRMAHGRWPDSLDDLVPDALEAVPNDPFSDSPFRYTRTEDGVVVYSVGPDLADNGGLSEQEAERLSGDDLDEGWDLPFRLIDPELRGARQATFPDEVMQSDVTLRVLREAGLGPDELKSLGLTDEDIEQLCSTR